MALGGPEKDAGSSACFVRSKISFEDVLERAPSAETGAVAGRSQLRPDKQLRMQDQRTAEVLRVTLERTPHEGFGLGVLFDGDAGVLAVIREDTPAMRCGQLRNGDRVVAINGQPVRVASDLNTLMPAEDVTTVTLELMRGGVTRVAATSAAVDAKVEALGPVGGTNGGTPGDAKVKALGPVTRWVNSRRCKSLVHERDAFKAKSQADSAAAQHYKAQAERLERQLEEVLSAQEKMQHQIQQVSSQIAEVKGGGPMGSPRRVFVGRAVSVIVPRPSSPTAAILDPAVTKLDPAVTKPSPIILDRSWSPLPCLPRSASSPRMRRMSPPEEVGKVKRLSRELAAALNPENLIPRPLSPSAGLSRVGARVAAGHASSVSSSLGGVSSSLGGMSSSLGGMSSSRGGGSSGAADATPSRRPPASHRTANSSVLSPEDMNYMQLKLFLTSNDKVSREEVSRAVSHHALLTLHDRYYGTLDI